MRRPPVVGIVVLWLGYTATWWGWLRLGGPVNLLDLLSPGRAGNVTDDMVRHRGGGVDTSQSFTPLTPTPRSGPGGTTPGLFEVPGSAGQA